MRLEARKYLFDIERATELVARFTAGKQFSDYEHDDMLRSAVERQFEIIGEALAQLSRLNEDLASQISEHAASSLSATSSSTDTPRLRQLLHQWTAASYGMWFKPDSQPYAGRSRS